MKIHQCIQGTPEWLHLRAGIPTASEFDKIITPGGKPSKSEESYRYRLLAERCMGHPCAEYISLWMQRGSQMEIDAVRFYELQTDIKTIPVGFITNDSETVGASPDRLVGEDGLLEIKVPAEHTHMGYLLASGGAYEAYKVQVQGQLWVTDRLWVDVLSFHPELPPAMIHIERDEDFINKIESLVIAFSHELEKDYEFVLERGYVKTREERTVDQLERSIPRLAPLNELVEQAKRALGEL
jgi:hypothetical protein